MQEIIPFYHDLDSKRWDELAKRKPSYVIINPADGPGPKDWAGRKDWIDLIEKLKRLGWKILYYIDVQKAALKNGKWELTRKTEKDLLGELSIYNKYNKCDGYFLDDYPNLEIYPEIKKLESQLSGLIVANPGTTVSEKVEKETKCNVFCLHETNGYPKKKPKISKKTYAIVFGEDSDKKLKEQGWDFGVVYSEKESPDIFTKRLPK